MSQKSVEYDSGGSSCAAPGCKNTFYSAERSFFRFPSIKDPERCEKWRINSRAKHLDKLSPKELYEKKLCSAHFETSQFMNESRNKLIWNAIPTLFDIPNPPKPITPMRRDPQQRKSAAQQQSTTPKRKRVYQTCRSLLPESKAAGLKPSPSPSRNDELEEEMSAEFTEAPKTTKDETDSPKEKKLKRDIQNLHTRLCREKKKGKPKLKEKERIKHLIHELRSLLPEETVDFIETQIAMAKRLKQGYRWSINDKMLALTIYYQSRKAYNILKIIFYLPSKATLQRTLSKMDIKPGFNAKLFNALKIKASSMSVQDRVCGLVYDEMSIKEFTQYNAATDSVEGFSDYGSEMDRERFVANHALVFMIRGLQSKWKQAIGYFLTSGPIGGVKLKVLIERALKHIEGTGLIVKTIICDQGSNNRSCMKSLFKNDTYMIFNNRRIFYMYDPPHLLKSIRNNFMKHGFLVNGQEVKWDYVAQFYYMDEAQPVRMAPKLNHKHIELPPFAKMKVSLAAQVLSHSVAAGISTLVQVNMLPREAVHTALFIDKMDKLFNAFNSKSLFSKSSCGGAISDKNSQVAFLSECLAWFDTITLPSGKSVPCIKGWILSIKSLLGLWEDLRDVYGYKFLLTNRLNQDCLENLFSVIRGKGGPRYNPTPQQFRSAFRVIVVERLLVQSQSTNCKADNDNILLHLSSISGGAQHSVTQPITDQSECNRSDYTQDEVTEIIACSNVLNIANPANIPVQNVTTYIGGYLLRKISVSDCPVCMSDFIQNESSATQERFVFTKNKAVCPSALIYPTDSFSVFVDSIEQVFSVVFPAVLHTDHVLKSLVMHSQDLHKNIGSCTNTKCKDRHRSFTVLYMKVRIHHALKTSNMINSKGGAGAKRNRKILILRHL